jgi:small subunit ribosomal protein S7
MSRRKRDITRRFIGQDGVYGSELMQKFINIVMTQGKKNVARTIVYEAMDVLTKKMNGDKEKALEFFNESFNRIIPSVEVRSRRVGGSVYQVPKVVNPDRGQALAMRWLISAAKTRPGKTMGKRLAGEMLDAYEGRGSAVKKRADIHRMAEANRAFSHFAW